MVYLYTSVFGATWLTVPWMYHAEIVTLKVRAKGSAWGGVGWSLGTCPWPSQVVQHNMDNNFRDYIGTIALTPQK